MPRASRVQPAQLKPGEEYYVAAMIGNASGGGAGAHQFATREIDVRCDAMAFNTVLSPGVALPSLGNLDATDSNAVYQQYFLPRLSYDVVGFRFNVSAVFAGAQGGADRGQHRPGRRHARRLARPTAIPA